MNRTTTLTLAVIVAALGCDEAPTRDMTQTTAGAQPKGADPYGMNMAGPHGYGDPANVDSGPSPPPLSPRQLNQRQVDRQGEVTPAARDYDRTGAGPPQSGRPYLMTQPRLITPRDQGNDRGDLDTTREIQSAIRGDQLLVAAAKTIDITTNDGIVTLRGHVASGLEKSEVEGKALSTPGVSRVDDEITVDAKPTY